MTMSDRAGRPRRRSQLDSLNLSKWKISRVLQDKFTWMLSQRVADGRWPTELEAWREKRILHAVWLRIKSCVRHQSSVHCSRCRQWKQLRSFHSDSSELCKSCERPVECAVCTQKKRASDFLVSAVRHMNDKTRNSKPRCKACHTCYTCKVLSR